MAFTPYPNTNNDYENPSIVVSNDKTTWVVPDGLTNPVVPFPSGTNFNADPDLVLDNGTMYLFYMEVTNNSSDTEIYYKTSADGVTWSNRTHIELPLLPTEFKSPAFIREADGWTLFYANGALYRTACATLNGTWSAPQLVYNQGVLSHVDVTKSGGIYYALLHQSNYTLRFAVSGNGLQWYIKSTDILTAGAAGHWTDEGFYRSTIQRTASGFDLWYSGLGGGVNGWRIGYTTITYSGPD